MGGCAGKNKSKQTYSDDSTSSSARKSDSKTKGNNSQLNSSPSSAKNLPSSNDVTANNNHTAENDIDPSIKVIIYEQDKISNALHPPIPSPVISVTNSELEFELANLVYGHPEHDYAESPPIATTFKSSDV